MLRNRIPFLKSFIDGASWGSAADGLALSTDNSPAGASEVNVPHRKLTPEQRYTSSVAVYHAVSLITRTVASAKVRCFTRNGEEIVRGDVINFRDEPSPRTKMRHVIHAMVAWYCIRGMMAGRYKSGNGSRGTYRVLNPTMLVPQQPHNPRTPSDVMQWRYYDGLTPWGQYVGGKEEIPASEILYERTFNPRQGEITGTSPLEAGGIFADMGIAAGDHIKQFYENGATPSGLIDLGPNVVRTSRDAWRNDFMARLGNATRGAWGWLVSSGTEIKVHSMTQPFDESFIAPIGLSDQQVFRVFGIGPYMAHLAADSRQDTAGQEIDQFYSYPILPLLELLTEAFQRDILDRHPEDFRTVHVSRPRKEALEKASVRKAFEKAEAENPASRILWLHDPDTLPDMWKVYAARTDGARNMRDTYHWSPARIQQFVGIDEEITPEQEHVWIPAGHLNITDPDFNAKLVPGVQGSGGGSNSGATTGGSNNRNESQRRTNRQRAQPSAKRPPRGGAREGNKSIGWPSRQDRRNFLSKSRPIVLTASERGELPRLADLDVIAEACGVDKMHCRLLRRALRESTDPKAVLKEYR